MIVILAVPLYSKNVFPSCNDASSQFDNVNVYFISFNPVVTFDENVGVLRFLVIAVLAFVSPSTAKVMSLIVNVLLFTPVKYLSVAIKSTFTVFDVPSILIFSVFHTGSTTSTITPVLSPSPVVGSSIPIVNVFAKLVFPDLSFAIFAGNANVIIPL